MKSDKMFKCFTSIIILISITTGFAYNVISDSLSGQPDDIVGADFNDDGLTEITISSRGADAVYLYRTTFTSLERIREFYIRAANYLTVGDFNGDGLPDLAIVALESPGNTNIIVYKGDRDRILDNLESFPGPPSAFTVTSGDFNGDGYDDLAIGSADTTGKIYYYYGSSTGLDSISRSVSVPLRGWLVVSAGRFDDDNYCDLIAGSPYTNGIYKIRGGSSGFQPPTSIDGSLDPVWGCDVGRLNNDIYPDIVLVHRNDSSLSLLTSDSEGNFRVVTTISLGEVPNSVQFVDFNADSLTDIVVSLQFANKVKVYLKDSFGNFCLGETIRIDTTPTKIFVISGYSIYQDPIFVLARTTQKVHAILPDIDTSHIEVIPIFPSSFNDTIIAAVGCTIHAILKFQDSIHRKPIPGRRVSVDGKNYYSNPAGIVYIPLGSYSSAGLYGKWLSIEGIDNRPINIIVTSLNSLTYEMYFGGTLGGYIGLPNWSPIELNIRGGVKAKAIYDIEFPFGGANWARARIMGRKVKSGGYGGLSGEIGIRELGISIVEFSVSGEESKSFGPQFSFNSFYDLNPCQKTGELGLLLESISYGDTHTPGIVLFLGAITQYFSTGSICNPYTVFDTAYYKYISEDEFISTGGFSIGKIRPPIGAGYTITIAEYNDERVSTNTEELRTGKGLYIPSSESDWMKRHSFKISHSHGLDLLKVGFTTRWYRSESRTESGTGSRTADSGGGNIDFSLIDGIHLGRSTIYGFTRSWHRYDDASPYEISLDLSFDMDSGVLFYHTHNITNISICFPSDAITDCSDDNILRRIVNDLERSGLSLNPNSDLVNLASVIDYMGNLVNIGTNYAFITREKVKTQTVEISPEVDIPAFGVAGFTLGFTCGITIVESNPGGQQYIIPSRPGYPPRLLSTVSQPEPPAPDTVFFDQYYDSLVISVLPWIRDIINALVEVESTIVNTGRYIVRTGEDIVHGAANLICEAGSYVRNSIVYISSYIPRIDFGGHRMVYQNIGYSRPNSKSSIHIVTAVGKAYEIYYMTSDSVRQDNFEDSVTLKIFIPDSAIKLSGFDPSLRNRLAIWHWTKIALPESLGGGEVKAMVEIPTRASGDTLIAKIKETGIYIAGIPDTIPDNVPPAVIRARPLPNSNIDPSDTLPRFEIDIADTGRFSSGIDLTTLKLTVNDDSTVGRSLAWTEDTLGDGSIVPVLRIASTSDIDTLRGSCEVMLEIKDRAGNQLNYGFSFTIGSDIVENNRKQPWDLNRSIVYPNPANNKLYLFIPSGYGYPKDNIYLTIYNIIGQKLVEKELRLSKNGTFTDEINIDRLPSGILFMNIRWRDKVVVKKILHLK